MLSIKRAFTILEFIVVVVIIAILAAVLWPVFMRPKHSGGSRSSCQSHLKQLGLGMMQYVKDYNEKFPLTTRPHGQGWANAVQPYIKSWQLFYCPSVNAESAKTSDYFYNARLSGLAAKYIENASLTIMMGDGIPYSPSNVSLSALPGNWLSDVSSPAKRHLDGANYGFADGHVKWFKPEKITMDNPRKSSNSTFLPR